MYNAVGASAVVLMCLSVWVWGREGKKGASGLLDLGRTGVD